MRGLFAKIEKGKFEFPDWIKGDAKDLIQKMLRTNPKKRITIPEIMKHPWFIMYVIFFIINLFSGYKGSEKRKIDLNSSLTDDMLKSAWKTEKEEEQQLKESEEIPSSEKQDDDEV